MAPGTMGRITLPGPHHSTGDGLQFLFGVLSAREAASYLGVSEAAVRADAETGRLPGQRVDGDWRFIRFALAEWLYRGAPPPPPNTAEASLNAPVPDETLEEQEAFLQRLRELRKQNGPAPTEHEATAGAKWDRERAAFRAMLPELLRTHAGQYVAIHDGRIVAAGTDKASVALAAYGACGYQPIPVLLVHDGPPRVVHLSGTPIGTPEMI